MKKNASSSRWIRRGDQTPGERRALEPGTFGGKPKEIAAALVRYGRRRERSKDAQYKAAISLLTFYVNRAGKRLSDKDRARLERAKAELRKSFGRT
jgi:hypothetical protein